MAKKLSPRRFNDVVNLLGTQRFDVAPAPNAAKALPQALQVSKHGCAAIIAQGPDGALQILARPGLLLNGQIARLVDRGYQKFFKSDKLEIPATADHLRNLHAFSEELKEAAGALSLYNEALGTTSDKYLYDRLQGREPAAH